MYYDFTKTTPDIKSIIHLIAQHGNDLIGLELGIFRGESFCCLLDNCLNIKTLYGIDSWKPYSDYLGSNNPSKALYSIDEKTNEINEFITRHNIKWSRNGSKANIIKQDSNECVTQFKDESLDFIFFDTYMTYEQAVKDFELWIPKVKKGGLITGHDWDTKEVQKAVIEYRTNYNITNIMSTFDSTWVWKK